MEDIRAQVEKRLNEEASAAHPGMWRGDNTSNLRRLKELKGNIPHPEAEAEGAARRAAAEARANAPRPKTMAEQFEKLQERVALLEKEPEQRSATVKRR
jgi:hypothetical protein